jgi:hypothetical protein
VLSSSPFQAESGHATTPRRWLPRAQRRRPRRALADNSVGKTITNILRAELFFRPVAAAHERRSLGIASHWPFEQWGKFLPEHTTAVSLLDRLLHHATIVITDGESHRCGGQAAASATHS